MSLLALLLLATCATGLWFHDDAYEEFTIYIDSRVPSDKCHEMLHSLEMTMIEGSEWIHTSTDGAAHLGSVSVVIPSNWPDTCVPGHTTVSSRGQTADMRIGPPHPIYKDSPWTQQKKPCGHPGDFIYFSYRTLLEPIETLGKMFAREWAKYRYGVFDEIGYEGDDIYPSCYLADLTEKVQLNGCSDKPLQDRGACSRARGVNATSLISGDAESSLLFSVKDRVKHFCSVASHDRFAPTKQNNLCGHRSVMEVILSHRDFINSTKKVTELMNITPIFTYKRNKLTRYLIVIEDTKDMIFRDSWSYLRMAIRKWLTVQLTGNVEVGIVAVNESSAVILQRTTPLHNSAIKDLMASNIPYTPGDSRAACLSCGIDLAYQLLEERRQTHDPANSVIVLIAPGTLEHTPELNELMRRIVAARIRIATITYPTQLRAQPLDWLSAATNGVAYTVMETNYNMVTSYVTTYFELTNVFAAIQEHFFQGDPSDLPIEIHRKQIMDNGKNSVVGNFVLDEWMGEPAKFTVLVHNIENPLIRSVTLVSPRHHVYSTRSDALLSLKLLTIPANINETGTWTYTIQRFPGSPQPLFVQVTATPRSNSAPIVSARLDTVRTHNSVILYCQVRRGDYPVLGAKVEIYVSKRGINGSSHHEQFELLDSGNGDPDLMRGDGVYSRYFSPHEGGAGVYTFETKVHDNFNTAYTWQHTNATDAHVITTVSCCGSVMPPPSVKTLLPFQRILPPVTLNIPYSSTVGKVLGRVGDLRVQVMSSEVKAKLIWTAPDLGGRSVAKYEFRYAFSIGKVLDFFESATLWDHGMPFPLAPGSETTFTLNFKNSPFLMDRPLYFAMRCYTELNDSSVPSKVSNWVRLVVPSPPPPPPVPIITSTLLPMWTSPTNEDIIPNPLEGFDMHLEFVVPISIGFILFIIAIVTYCYFCLRRKTREAAQRLPEKRANVSVVPAENESATVPSSPVDPGQHDMNNESAMPNYEVQIEDEYKRYSANYEPSTGHYGTTTAGNLSVIPEYDNQTNTLSRDKTLSPYQSWTASQLLHEHERRTSPYGQVEDYSSNYAPPIPPLPNYHQEYPHPTHLPPPNQFMTYPNQSMTYPNQSMIYPNQSMTCPNQSIYNQSFHGSMTSINGTDKQLRHVTMV